MTTQTDTVTVRVLCFAQLKDRLGFAEQERSLPAGSTARDLLGILRDAHPAESPLLEVSRLAINCEFVPGETPLRDGDEVGVIPPVSGG